MTLVRWKDRTIPTFGDVLDTFFKDVETVSPWNRGSVPAVNIRENDDNYFVAVAAPGLKKEDFKINVENETLTISSERQGDNEESNEHFTRKEFSFSSFTRSFWLPDTVDSDKINAKYTDGVLNITIPKKEEAKRKPAREIKIS